MGDASTPKNIRKIDLTSGFKIFDASSNKNERIVKLVKQLSNLDSKDVETNCDLENEIDQEDQALIDFLTAVKTLNNEQLQFLGKNNEEFWEKCAEAIRVDLKDNLDDNEKVCYDFVT